MRSLASAKNQQSRASAGRLARHHFKECMANRHPRQAASRKVTAGFLEVHRRCRNHGRDQPISKSRDNVGFECQCWHTVEGGREHRRPGRVPAYPDHYMRTEFRQHTPGIPYSEGKAESCFETRGQADILESSNLNETKRETRCRDQAVFNPARRANKQHLGDVVPLKFLSNGERGDDMSTNTASRQNDAPAGTIK